MKRIFLYVSGGDYSASEFEDRYDAQAFYDLMVERGQERVVIRESYFRIEVKIMEFESVSEDFLHFVKHELCDYDDSKDQDIFEVKPVSK